MAKEKMQLHAYRITAKQNLKVKKKAEKSKVSQSEVIRKLISSL